MEMITEKKRNLTIYFKIVTEVIIGRQYTGSRVFD